MMAAPQIIDGHGIHNFRCDKYRCELIMTGVSIRQESGGDIFEVTGVAATTDEVNGEIFTPEVLERDGKNLIGKPITDNHSEYPARILVKDIIGRVTDVWYNRSKNELMFKGEIWDEQAMRVLEKKLVVNFSVGYKWKYHVREDGIMMSDSISFDHLGFLSNPADNRAVNETIRKVPYKADMEYVDVPVDIRSIRELRKFNGLMEFGYEYAKRNENRWGSINILEDDNDIIKNNSRVISELMKGGIPFNVRSELDQKTLEFMRTEKLQVIADTLEDVNQINTPLKFEGTSERIVKKMGDKICVLHGHPQKEGSKTDKPEGTPIKCYSIAEFGEAGAMKKAQAMHYAIAMSEKREDPISEVDHALTEKKSEVEIRENTNTGGTMAEPAKVEEQKVDPVAVRSEAKVDEAKVDPVAQPVVREKAVSPEGKEEPVKGSEAKPEGEAIEKEDSKEESAETERASKKNPLDEEVSRLREDIKKREEDLKTRELEIVKFKEAEKTRKTKENIEGLLRDKLFVPAEREKLEKFVTPMSDEQFKAFRELVKNNPAYSTKEKGTADDAEESERKKKESVAKAKEDPYHQNIT